MKIKKLLSDQERQTLSLNKRLPAKKDDLAWKPPVAGKPPAVEVENVESKNPAEDAQKAPSEKEKEDVKSASKEDVQSVTLSTAQKSAHSAKKKEAGDIDYELEVPEPDEDQFLHPLYEAYNAITTEQLKYLEREKDDVDDYLEDLLQINEGGHKAKIKGYRAAFDVVEKKREKSKYKFNPNVYDGIKDLTSDEIKMRVV